MNQSPVKYQKLTFSEQTIPITKKTDQASKDTNVLEYYSIFFVIRLSKITITTSVAVLLTLMIFNNLTLYMTHFEFIQNVMSMKAVFLENIHSWRAITSPLLHQLFYGIMMIWQMVAAILCWWGIYQCWRTRTEKSEHFNQAKIFVVAGLTLALLLWMMGFLIGTEWFLMWQSEIWNGQDQAFRMMTTIGIILIFVCLPDDDHCKR